MYGGTRCILLEVSALGARDRLSTSHYRGRSPYPTQSPYGGSVDRCPNTAGDPSETWVRAVGDPWTPRSPRSFPTGLAVGGFRAARVVEKHHAPVLGSEGLGELAGAGPRSSSAGGGRPGNGASLVDLFVRFFGTSSESGPETRWSGCRLHLVNSTIVEWRSSTSDRGTAVRNNGRNGRASIGAGPRSS